MPYYIIPKVASTLIVTSYNSRLYSATNSKLICATTYNEYTLRGIYEPTNIKGYYSLSANGNISFYTKDTILGPYRWYMSVRDRMATNAELENY